MNTLPFTLETLDFVRLKRLLESPRAAVYKVFAQFDLAALRQAPHLQTLQREIAALAQQSQIPALSYSAWTEYERSGNRQAYDQPYFQRRALLAALALRCTLQPEDDGALERLHDLIFAILEESAWASPPHVPLALFNAGLAFEVIDLFASETAHALAETLSLLQDKIQPALKKRVLLEFERRIWIPYARLERPVWEAKQNNWAAVCSGNLGMVALLTFSDQKQLIGVLTRVLETQKTFLSGYSPSGATAEGIAYWRYGFGYFCYFAEMLREYSDGQIDLLQSEKVQRIAAFPVALALHEDHFVNFSDAPEYCPLEAGLLSHLKGRLGVPTPVCRRVASFHRDHCYRFAHLSRNLFWSDPELFTKNAPSGFYAFPELAWLTHQENGFVFACKGGHNDEPHNQNDLGQFVLHALGDTLLCDLGRGQYTKAYFSSQRYSLLHPSSRGHSLPVINGFEQGAGEEFFALLRDYHFEQALTAEFDLSKAYPDPNLLSYTRELRWEVQATQAALHLTDSFTFNSTDNHIQSALISLFEPTITTKEILWQGKKARLRLELPLAWAGKVEVLDTQAHLGEPLRVYRTVFEKKCAEQEKLALYLTLEAL